MRDRVRDTSHSSVRRFARKTAAVTVSIACVAVPVIAWGAPAAGAATAASTPVDSVACVRGPVCFGVGSLNPRGASRTVIKRWNGSGWFVQASPNAAARYGSALYDVACTSPTNCFAVGGSWRKGQTASDYGTLVERWNGKKWSIVKTPNVGNVNTVSCSSATNCFIGTSLRWNGKTWSKVATKFAAYSVSCTSATNCLALGFPSPARWSGTTWSKVPNPAPQSSIGQLTANDVSCTSPTNCLAIGSYSDGLFSASPAAERWNGKAWSNMLIPSPPGDPIFMYGISCSGPTNCFAVGTSNPENGTRPFAVSERWNGTKWSVVKAAMPAGRQSGFSAVSCASAKDCTAVGVSWEPLDGNNGSYLGPSRPLYEHWNGTAWSIV